jgi:hypothetical protein
MPLKVERKTESSYLTVALEPAFLNFSGESYYRIGFILKHQ